MSDFEPGQEFVENKSNFVPKEHFVFEVPKDVNELKTRLLSALDSKTRGWVHNPRESTNAYIFDSMGESTGSVPLDAVEGWTFDKSVADLLNEDRGDNRGLDHVMEIIKGWNGESEDRHKNMTTEGLTFISNEPGKYILYEGKHRYLAAVAMGIKEIPAKIDLYTRKPLPN